jgi:hypothetical protein
VPEGDDQLEPEPRIFLSLGNHLGSTSAVIDFRARPSGSPRSQDGKKHGEMMRRDLTSWGINLLD